MCWSKRAPVPCTMAVRACFEISCALRGGPCDSVARVKLVFISIHIVVMKVIGVNVSF